MEKKNKNRNFIVDFLILFILSLTPFIWTWGNHVILGHDAGTPVNPTAHFLDRLFTWTHRYGMGADQSFAIPGFFIHGIEYVFDVMHMPLWLNQSISFSLYFFLIGSSMYFLAYTLFGKQKEINNIPLFSSVFYMVNHFTIQAWFIAERTKFTTYIMLPVMLAMIYKIYKNEAKPFKAALISALLLTVFNGGGFIPIFGSLIVCLPLFTILLIIISTEKRSFAVRIIFYSILTFVGFVILNLYWLLPYISYVTNSFAGEVSKSGGFAGVLEWATSISLNASFLNLFRLQGIQEWYVNPFHTYAHYFLTNPILIFISFLLPILAFASVRMSKGKERQLLIIISLLGIVSLFFIAGVHAPFGIIYAALLRYIPGFLAFRTPYYKFAPGLWLAYSLMIAYTASYLLSLIKLKSFKTKILGKIIVVLFIAAYSFPLFGTHFFTYFTDRSTRAHIPQYVFDYANFMNSDKFTGNRILLLPPQSDETYAEVTDWGYWSIATLNSLIDPHSYVSPNLTNSKEENALIIDLYKSIEQNDPIWVRKAQLLGIDSFLLRKDMVEYKKNGLSINSTIFERAIKSIPYVHKERSFGKWEIYRFSQPTNPITTFDGYYKIADFQKKADPFPYDLPLNIATGSAFLSDSDFNVYKDLKRADIIIPNCEHCSLIRTPLIEENRDIRILPGSPFYKFKLRTESSERAKLTTPESRLRFQTVLTIRRLFEAEKLYETNALEDGRTIAWAQYSQDLTLLKTHLDEYLKNMKEDDASNKFLLNIQDSLIFESNELKGLLSKISRLEEGKVFLSAYNQIRPLVKYLDSRTVETVTPLNKKYYIPITDQGIYDVYVKNNTVSISGDNENISVLFNKNKYTAQINKNGNWTKITTSNLKSGTYELELDENNLENIINPARIIKKSNNIKMSGTNSLKLLFDKNNECVDLTLGNLPNEQYILTYSIVSESQPFTIQTFINSENNTLPLLPYLSKPYSLTQNPQTIKHFIETAFDHSVYTYRICQLYDEDARQNAVITDLKLNPISQPKVALIHVNENFTNTKTHVGTIKTINNTEYSIKSISGTPAVIMLDQRYDPRWKLTLKKQNKEIAPIKVNNFANAWFVDSNGSSASIAFTSQKLFNTGAIISLISFVVIAVYLFL